MYLKIITQLEYKNLHLKQCISWIVGGLTTSSYVVYDYTTSGCMDLWNTWGEPKVTRL